MHILYLNFTFLLHVFFYNLGFIGIFGIFMMYYCYKKRRKLFYILFSWLVFLMGFAFSLFFYYYIKHSSINLYNLPKQDFFRMMLWFKRTWHYTIIPLSIFASICNSPKPDTRYSPVSSFIFISGLIPFSHNFSPDLRWKIPEVFCCAVLSLEIPERPVHLVFC